MKKRKELDTSQFNTCALLYRAITLSLYTTLSSKPKLFTSIKPKMLIIPHAN